MASTSIHFPRGLLERLDGLAQERGISRNRLVVQVCEEALERCGAWPEGFFDDDHLADDEIAELQRDEALFLRTLEEGRTNRPAGPFP